MTTASEFPHFYERDGVKKRNVLTVDFEDARMEGSFPRDGSVTVRIKDEETQKAFKMTPQETLVLSSELEGVAKELLTQKRALWKQRQRPTQ